MKTVVKVQNLRKEHPDWTLEQIANFVGRTRGRISQILKDHHLPARAIRIKRCPRCQSPDYSSQKPCSNCHFLRHFRLLQCALCLSTNNLIRRSEYRKMILGRRYYFFCSPSCRSNWRKR